MSNADEQRRAEDMGEGFVRISNRELYDMMTQVRDRVSGVENKVENAFGPQGIMVKILQENTDLRKRVRGLELRFYGIAAGLLAATIVLLKAGGVPV